MPAWDEAPRGREKGRQGGVTALSPSCPSWAGGSYEEPVGAEEGEQLGKALLFPYRASDELPVIGLPCDGVPRVPSGEISRRRSTGHWPRAAGRYGLGKCSLWAAPKVCMTFFLPTCSYLLSRRWGRRLPRRSGLAPALSTPPNAGNAVLAGSWLALAVISHAAWLGHGLHVASEVAPSLKPNTRLFIL